MRRIADRIAVAAFRVLGADPGAAEGGQGRPADRPPWPVTGEIGGCPLHPDMAPTVIRERFMPESAGGFASRRAKKKYRR